MEKHLFKKSILALSLGVAPMLAHADTTADILRQLAAVQAKVHQLETQLHAQQQQISANEKTAHDTASEADHTAVKVTGIEDANESAGLKGLKISGMIAPAYVYNRDQQASSFVFLNRSNGSPSAFSLYNYDNSYFGDTYIDFQKTTEGGTLWHLTLAPDRGAGVMVNGNSIVNEASVAVPVAHDTKLIAGQIPDWEGYEVPWDNQNKAITHNLLFDFTEMGTYTGVGIDKTVGLWEWKTMLANINSPRYYYGGQGGRAPAVVFRADRFWPSDGFEDVGFWALIGKVPNIAVGPSGSPLFPTGTSSAAMFEIDGSRAEGDWGYYGQFSAGQQTGAAFNGGTARWYGMSALVTRNFTPRLLGFARFDYLNDSKNGGGLPGGYIDVSGTGNSGTPADSFNSVNGFGPGYVQDAGGNWVMGDPNRGANRYALSLGWNYQLTHSTTLKMEYRYDRSSLNTFYKVSNQGFTKNNSLLAGSVVVSF